MKRTIVCAGIAVALLAAVPAFATPVPQGGVTLEDMAGILSKAGMPATITKDSNGRRIVTSKAVGVNFDVYLYQCNQDNRCADIQFAAGWTNAHVNAERVNEWNTTKRFLRVYYKPGDILWAEQDARVLRGTIENINECLAFWKVLLGEFKTFMKLN